MYIKVRNIFSTLSKRFPLHFNVNVKYASYQIHSTLKQWLSLILLFSLCIAVFVDFKSAVIFLMILIFYWKIEINKILELLKFTFLILDIFLDILKCTELSAGLTVYTTAVRLLISIILTFNINYFHFNQINMIHV